MRDHEVLNAVDKADKAVNAGDFETVVQCYASDATLVVAPGTLAKGKEEISQAYLRIAEYFNNSLHVTQEDMVVIEAGDIALVLAKTHIESPNKKDSEFSSDREAIYVYKKDSKGNWLCAIDNSYGVELLTTRA